MKSDDDTEAKNPDYMVEGTIDSWELWNSFRLFVNIITSSRLNLIFFRHYLRPLQLHDGLESLLEQP